MIETPCSKMSCKNKKQMKKPNVLDVKKKMQQEKIKCVTVAAS